MRRFVLGEFATGEQMVAAAAALREAGHVDLDSYSPFPVHGADEALGLRRSWIPLIVLCCGLLGAATGYSLQYYCNVWDYPINVAGRPLHSPPTYIPVVFELAVLFGSLGAFLGTWALAGLPRPHHPVFELEAFRSATIDRFWISLRTTDDPAPILEKMTTLGALLVDTVEDVT
jgi:hypothetical protein